MDNTKKNYIKKPSLYNTGYVLNDDISRMKQGLMSNNSLYCKNCYNDDKINYNAFKLAQTTTQDKLIKPVLNKDLLYPIHNDGVKYGLREINNNCECVRYIQAP